MVLDVLRRARAAVVGAHAERRDRRAATRLMRDIARLPHDLGADPAVEFLFSDQARVIQPWQHLEEFHSLARLIERRRPRAVLEIGTADGGTLFAHTRLAAEDALVISIDLPEGPFGGGYPSWRVPLYRSFARSGQRIELLRADSHDPATGEQLASILGGRRVDYAFIDGDHSYTGVRQDFELCRRFAADDAIIAFHDIVEHPPETNCLVHDFWREVCADYPHEEYILDRDQGCYGIGVIFMGERGSW
jgi:cephalosporin hydroxylase